VNAARLLAKFAKAIYSGLIGGLGSLSTVLVGHARFDSVTAGQWVAIALVALVSAGGVYGLTNKPPAA
jgi:hypothetical protein